MFFGGMTKDASALSPLSRIISLTVDGEVISVGLLVREFLTMLLDDVDDATTGLVELLLLLLLLLLVLMLLLLLVLLLLLL